MLRTLLAAAGSLLAPGTARSDRQGHIRMSTAPAKTPRLVPELRPTAALQLYLETIIYKTRERLELINISRDLNEVARQHGLKAGLLIGQSLHTTSADFIHESQQALLDDLTA